MFRLLAGQLGAVRRGDWAQAPSLSLRTLSHVAHPISPSVPLFLHLGLFFWLSSPDAPTSVFLSLESASFCPLHPEVRPATTQVCSQVPPPPSASLLSGGVKLLSCQLCAWWSPAWGSGRSPGCCCCSQSRAWRASGAAAPALAPACLLWCHLGRAAGFRPGRKEPGIWVQSLCETRDRGNSKDH